MTTENRKASWRAYYERHRERINEKRRARSKTAAGDSHRARALGYYYEHRQEQNLKRTRRFVDSKTPRGDWSREVEAIK